MIQSSQDTKSNVISIKRVENDRTVRSNKGGVTVRWFQLLKRVGDVKEALGFH